MRQESVFADLLRARGLELDDEPGDFTDALLYLPMLPQRPIYFMVADKRQVLGTMLVDETGRCWKASREVDLSDCAFEDYFDFRERKRAHASN